MTSSEQLITLDNWNVVCGNSHGFSVIADHCCKWLWPSTVAFNLGLLIEESNFLQHYRVFFSLVQLSTVEVLAKNYHTYKS